MTETKPADPLQCPRCKHVWIPRPPRKLGKFRVPRVLKVSTPVIELEAEELEAEPIARPAAATSRPKRSASSRPATSRPAAATVDTAEMSTAQLFKHYKSTAPLGDVRFMLTHARMSDGLRSAFVVLEAAIVELQIRNRADIYAQYTRLQDAWRLESNRRQWAVGYLEAFAVTWPADRTLPAVCVSGLELEPAAATEAA